MTIDSPYGGPVESHYPLPDDSAEHTHEFYECEVPTDDTHGTGWLRTLAVTDNRSLVTHRHE